MLTVTDVLSQTAAGGKFYLLLGDFLDEFYRADMAVREAMIADPGEADLTDESLHFMAAAVHKLCNDCGMYAPDWVFEKRCYASKPFFACRAQGNLRLLFMYTSPTEFKHRNLFVDENVLKRV